MLKDMGVLGVIDLDKFSRALRLRYIWEEWMVDDKPWVGTEVPCNNVDRLLFNPSTTILLGNGSKAKKFGTIAGSMERPQGTLPPISSNLSEGKQNDTSGNYKRHLDQSIEEKDHYSNAS